MTDRRRPRALLALLMLVALVLITLDFRAGDGGVLSRLQETALSVFAPLQEGVATVTEPVGGFVSAISDIGQRRERIAQLERELERVRQRRFSMADLERENARLRELLDMRQRHEFTTRTSRVIAPPRDASRWTALIDIGANQGVQPDMAVINADGLVGKVIKVTPEYARIRLASSPQAHYAVRLTNDGEQALLSGRGERPMELQVIEESDVDLEAGTGVVTRAYQGTSIPDGLPVGQIAEGGPVDRMTSYPVEPAVDFSRLDLVMVVLDTAEAPESLDPGQQGATGQGGPSGQDGPGDQGGSPTPQSGASPSAIDPGAAVPGAPGRPPVPG